MQCAMPPWPRVPLRPDNGGRAGAVDNHDYVQDYYELVRLVIMVMFKIVMVMTTTTLN